MPAIGKMTFRGCCDLQGQAPQQPGTAFWGNCRLGSRLPSRALRPLGTQTPGCRAATPPRAVTRHKFWGFDAFDVMMPLGMQAAVWREKPAESGKLSPTRRCSPARGCHLPLFKGLQGAAFPPHFHLPRYPPCKHPSWKLVPIAGGLIASLT